MRSLVNIHDYTVDKSLWGECRLDAIFKRQRELMDKYHEIEAANGLLLTDKIPVNLHNKLGQARLKDFAWRTTEEIGEAIEARERHCDIPDHCYEELADALHFLTEFTILSGITPEDLMTIINSDRDAVPGDKLDQFWFWKYKWDAGLYHPMEILLLTTGEFVKNMGMACNCFKNKPWKQTQMMTDEKEFYKWVGRVWRSFITICHYAGLDAESLTEYYFGKSEVNKFRQRSNY